MAAELQRAASISHLQMERGQPAGGLGAPDDEEPSRIHLRNHHGWEEKQARLQRCAGSTRTSLNMGVL